MVHFIDWYVNLQSYVVSKNIALLPDELQFHHQLASHNMLLHELNKIS
jgi:hypothetical protein